MYKPKSLSFKFKTHNLSDLSILTNIKIKVPVLHLCVLPKCVETISPLVTEIIIDKIILLGGVG